MKKVFFVVFSLFLFFQFCFSAPINAQDLTIKSSPETISKNREIVFSFFSESSENDAETNAVFNWFLFNSKNELLANSSESTLKYTFLESGNYKVKVEVKFLIETGDGMPKRIAITKEKDFFVENKEPVADFSFKVKGRKVFFESSARDPDNDLLSFFWSFGDNQSSELENPEHVYLENGSYNVTLTVKDNEGLTSTKQKKISVFEDNSEELSLLPSTKIIASVTEGFAVLAVEFSAETKNFQNPDNLEYFWDFGDNSTGKGKTVSYLFQNPGNYRVALRVTDKTGLTNEKAFDEITINVKEKSVKKRKVVIEEPRKGTIVSGVVPVKVKARNVSKIRVFVNNVFYLEKTLPFIFEFDSKKFGEKYSAEIVVKALDSFGNILYNENQTEVFDKITLNVDNTKKNQDKELAITFGPTATVFGPSLIVSWQTNKESSSTLLYWKAESNEDKATKISVKTLSSFHKLSVPEVSPGKYFFKVKSFAGNESAESKKQFFEVQENNANYPRGFKPEYCSLYCGLNLSGTSINSPPEINSLTVLSEKREEGSPITFVVDAFDPDNDDIYYTWDFGDGSTAYGKNLFRVKHAYYLEDKNKENFVVRLTIDDRVSGSDRKAKSIEVTKAKYKIVLFSPVSSMSKKLLKGKKYDLNIGVTDSTGKIVLAENIEKFEARIQGTEIKMKNTKKAIFYSPLFTQVTFTSPLSYVEVEAVVRDSEGKHRLKASLPLYIEPTKYVLKRTPVEEKAYYVGKNIGKISFELVSENGLKPESLEVKVLLSPEQRAKKFIAKEEGDKYVVEINHLITEEEVEKGVVLWLKGEDEYGNKIRENTIFAIPVLKENPEFNLELLNPSKNSVIGYSEDIQVRADIKTKKEIDKKNVVVTITIPSENKVKELKFNGETFEGTIKAPSLFSGKKKLLLKLNAWLKTKNSVLRDFEENEFVLTNKLEVEFVQPKYLVSFISPSDRNKILVSIKFPTKNNFNQKTVTATYSFDGQKKVVVLTKNNETGLYEAPAKLVDGEHFLGLELQGDYTGRDSLKTYIFFIDPNLLAVTILLIVLFLFVRKIIIEHVLSEQAKKARQARKIEKMLMKRENLLGLLKKLKIEYYKRHITEKEYKERLLKTQQELKKLEKEVGLDKKR